MAMSVGGKPLGHGLQLGLEATGQPKTVQNTKIFSDKEWLSKKQSKLQPRSKCENAAHSLDQTIPQIAPNFISQPHQKISEKRLRRQPIFALVENSQSKSVCEKQTYYA